MQPPLLPTPHTPQPSSASLALIYARSENYCIGKGGKIPWHLPDEFAHFKKTTMGKPIIMGRKTYEDHKSALPGRLNLVVTRNPDYQVAKSIETADSLDAAIKRGLIESNEVFIIGGVGLFTQAFLLADHVYETVVHTQVDGETILPAFDFTAWDAVDLGHHPADDRHAYAFTMRRYDRVKPTDLPHD